MIKEHYIYFCHKCSFIAYTSDLKALYFLCYEYIYCCIRLYLMSIQIRKQYSFIWCDITLHIIRLQCVWLPFQRPSFKKFDSSLRRLGSKHLGHQLKSKFKIWLKYQLNTACALELYWLLRLKLKNKIHRPNSH